jgi:AraC-like DNA-binding protein
MRTFFTDTDPVVPVHHPRILVQTAVERGADLRALLADVGVSAEALELPETRLTYAQFSCLERNALRLTGIPALGLHAGRNVTVQHAGMLAVAATNRPTGFEALEMVVKYVQWLAPGWNMEVDSHSGLFTLRETIPRGDLLPFATEWVICGLITVARAVMGSVPVKTIAFGYEEPEYAHEYAGFFDCPVTFGHAITRAVLDLDALARPLRFADPAMARLAEQYCATEVAHGTPGLGLLEQVRRLLEGSSGAWPEVDDAARALRTSGRSLRRGLRHMGTSYQELVDEVRLERASELVRNTTLPLERISEELGFSDVRSFRRAFKRWTGLAPSAVRGALAPTNGPRH